MLIVKVGLKPLFVFNKFWPHHLQAIRCNLLLVS